MSLRKQLDCQHEQVVESHKPSAYLLPSLRVCKNCGFAERGWTHHILRGEEFPQATLEECQALVVGPEHESSTFDWYYPEDRRDCYIHAIRKAFKNG